MIDHRVRVGDSKLDSGRRQFERGRRPWRMNIVRVQFCQLRHEGANIIPSRIERCPLLDRIEDAEIGGRVGPAASDPLPAGGIGCEIGIDQVVPEPVLPGLPGDEQVLDQE